MNTAMIFAAGRGERMRPLTDHTPKPLLEVGGVSLIERQIVSLAKAGIGRIVINHAWLGEQFPRTLGDGARWGVELLYSSEGDQSLETAGGIAKALPLILEPKQKTNVFIAVAGDIYADFDYTQLFERAAIMEAASRPGMHLVMVPNPDYHPKGDFFLDVAQGGRVSLEHTESVTDGASSDIAPQRLTFGSIGLYDTRSFSAIAARSPIPRMALLPIFRETIASGRATGERFDGTWANIGTPGELQALDHVIRAGEINTL